MYHGFKTFIHEAYTRRLTAISLRNTVGSLGYVGNNANAFSAINSTTGEETDNDDATTITQAAAAATTGSMLGNTYGATGTSASLPAEVTAAIQQLSANQMAMMQQFTAFTVNNQPPPRRNVQVPPVTNINIPQQQYGGFQQTSGGFRQGHGGRQGGGCSHGDGRSGRRGGRIQNVYAQAPTTCIPQYIPQMGGPQQNYMLGFNNGSIVPAVAGRQATGRGGRQNPAYSNQYKIFNNWNVCYSHRFDVEDGHNSATYGNRKMNHQEGFTCKNAQAYIDAGYAPIT